MADTATLTLTDFLLARIAEDETAVNERTRYGAPPGSGLLEQFGDFGDDERWMIEMPAGRLLAECEAKRRIVDGAGLEIYRDLCRRALAAIYADHPDYRDEWRP